ncbi:DUF4091 domain-containing protein [Parabacteroides distasonis]|nr:DUF4091 domain-containing protein [Parabacteroides distasonis]
MKHLWMIGALLALNCATYAQETEKYPLGDYTELTDTKPHDDAAKWNQLKQATQLSWGSIDVRYPKLSIPHVQSTSRWQGKAWRGERVNAQAVLWSKTALEDATLTVSDLKCGSAIIPSESVSSHFVRYVMTDELNKDRKGGCGVRENKAEWDSSIVADVLDIVKLRDVQACSTQPIWLQVRVPADAKAGKYKGTLTVSGQNFQPMSLQIELEVVNRTLTAPQEWPFHLDLWQNPYAVARYYQVPLWSQAHFDAMRPIMKMLAEAGQKAITTSIMHKPWAGQTEDHFDSMVFRMKKLDGSWVYDYTVFDKWVDFMLNDVGIDGTISCYTMIPWALTFDYFDQATNRIQFVNCKPGDAEYTEYWGNFLKDFSRHLHQKGWFERTAISMDERPMEAMREAIKVIKQADPAFKITLAGNLHKEIEGDLYYLSIPYGNTFPAEMKAERDRKGQISTVYTCCAEAFPNTFTFSDPAEATWTPIHAVAGGYDGYLRWAVNSWTADPLRDSRFRTWAAGDTYSIYPGPRSSIRFERLVEGLQDCEKIRLLRQSLKGSKLDKLNKCVAKFTPEGLSDTQQSYTEMVRELETLLNTL